MAISTHAPRTGSDDGRRRTSAAAKDFNPRSPHGERPCPGRMSRQTATISTHAPRTGSDGIRRNTDCRYCHFNPRSPHGERRGASGFPKRHSVFQPTLPARGATDVALLSGRNSNQFQPTLPARGATANAGFLPSLAWISTHAPRTGSDLFSTLVSGRTCHFNPRSPHGERRKFAGGTISTGGFQPTLPARGAT